jgi:hypothetical protein
MELFKIKTSDHFRHLWLYILIAICFPAIIYFLLLYKKGYFESNTALLVGGIFFLGNSMPLLSLHLNYYLRNRNDMFKYDKSTSQAIYKSGKGEIKFEGKNICKITIYKSWPMSRNDVPIFAWDFYNYAVIKLKNGRVIKLSSLLVNELDKVVKFDNVEIKKTLYAWMG